MRAAGNSFEKLVEWSAKQACPCRAKLQLAQADDGRLIIALIYPAEYDQQVGCWLGDGDFRVDGAVDAGCSQVTRYYDSDYQILERRQLLAVGKSRARDLDELLASVDQPLQRQLA